MHKLQVLMLQLSHEKTNCEEHSLQIRKYIQGRTTQTQMVMAKLRITSH